MHTQFFQDLEIRITWFQKKRKSSRQVESVKVKEERESNSSSTSWSNFQCLKRMKTVEKDVGKNICRLLSSNSELVKYYTQFNA
jgi:hypothetical protein